MSESECQYMAKVSKFSTMRFVPKLRFTKSICLTFNPKCKMNDHNFKLLPYVHKENRIFLVVSLLLHF